MAAKTCCQKGIEPLTGLLRLDLKAKLLVIMRLV
jgi:hypothetical protein